MIKANSVVVKYLKKRGYNIDTSYYSYIDYWTSWYENMVKDFHKYYDELGREQEIYKLGMAKKIPEDWSSVLYTERDELVCSNSNNQEYINEQFNDDNLDFNNVVSDNIEKAFYSGTAGTITRLVNVKKINNELVGDDKTKFNFVNVTADKIIPLTVDNGKITEVAIVSESKKNNETTYYIEMHTLIEDGYKIENIYLNSKGEEIPKENTLREYETHSFIPLFNLLTPKIVNNIDRNTGLGISIYANAIDQLKMDDTAYNNWYMDTYLGGKKLFYNKSLVRYETQTYVDSNGEQKTREIPIYPDDVTRQQFKLIGDEFESSGSGEGTLFHEYNPDLRTDSNEKNINLALNLTAFKCGLGKGFYRFENGTIVTATQYLGENKDLVDHAKKHRANLNKYTVGVARSVLLLGKLIFGLNLDENDKISLVDKDGFLVSDEELKNQWRQDYNLGMMSKKEYIMKTRGVNEEEALKIIEEIEAETPTTESILGGGNDE